MRLKSCIYEGKVRHRRNTPRHHEFDFRTFMLFLDLDELESVFKSRWFWSTSRFAPFRFRKSDHLKSESATECLKQRAINVLRTNGFDEPVFSIRLLTQLRYFGFAMNPVSFFYCFDENDSLLAIVAEVNNTPWGEQHCYVITAENAERHPACENLEKTFHVSPFMSMEMGYRMAFSAPHQKLGVKIENHLHEPGEDGVEKILDVSMLLKRKPITTWSLNSMLLKYPLISFQIFLSIYWHALRLYLKGVPFFSHPKNKLEPDGNSQSVDPVDSNDFENASKDKDPESILVRS